jgi:serine/threonine-protein kinase
MSVGRDDLTDPRFANLDAVGTVELCNSLADYGEAGGLSRDLMLQVGRFAEARFGDHVEVLLAAARMYLQGGEIARSRDVLLRAGKLGREEVRVGPLLEQVLRLLDDPRSAVQALREAPSVPPLVSGPPPPASEPPLSPPELRATTPRQWPLPSPPPPRRAHTPTIGQPTVPRAPAMPRGFGEPPPDSRGALALRPMIETPPARPEEITTEVSRRAVAREPLPDSSRHGARQRAAGAATGPRLRAPAEPAPLAPAGGPARTTRIRLLDLEDDRRLLHPYELIGEIASGGMAKVFLGRIAGDGGFQRFVAIKRLHPHLASESQFVQMFLDEARIAAAIHNPHVVPILEVGTSDAGYYVVMEFVEGDTLWGLITRSHLDGAILPPPVALRVVLDALTGLHAAHQLTDADDNLLGLVHRDCTPQNILVGVDGSARITDFGVARAAARLTVTRPQQVKGKLGYLSPEQAHGEEVDRRSDVFTMGIVMWEALAGRPLFQADTEAATLARLVSGAIPSVRSFVPDTPPALDEVCRRALQRDPHRRFRTAAEMADAIEQVARAERFAGIASPRDLGRFVEGLMGAEIAAQRAAVRSWLAQIDVTPMSRGGRTPPSAKTAPSTTARSSSPPPPPPGEEPPAAKKAPPVVAEPASEKAAPAKPAPPPLPAAVSEPEPVETAKPTVEEKAPPVEIEKTEPPIVTPAPPPAATGLSAVIARLSSAKLSKPGGIALVVVLVVLATAPLWLKKISQEMRPEAPPASTARARPAGAPRKAAPASAPAPQPAWDEDWPLPDGGPAGQGNE